MTAFDDPWTGNYYNYYTEVEEHFQRVRGTALFQFSPLDWALIETWKNEGVPLEAVLRGIDAAFEKWRARKKNTRMINSLAYCAQAVAREAEILAGALPQRRPAEAPFPVEALRAFLENNAARLSARGKPVYSEIAAVLETLAADAEAQLANSEELEQRLDTLEMKMIAAARLEQTGDDLLADRKALDNELRPYRSKMTAEQLARLEAQFLTRALLERAGLPRLSLFYLH